MRDDGYIEHLGGVVPENTVMELAHRAAELLPEPPAAHDPFGYLAWEELVVSTACRLQGLVVDAAPLLSSSSVALPVTLTLQPGTARLDGEALLTLAALLAVGDDTACSGALTQAVATCQGASATAHAHGRHEHHQRAGHRRSALYGSRRSFSGVAAAPRG